MAMAERKPFLLRIDSDLYTALARWADDELRSLNGQIEFLLNRILAEAGRIASVRFFARSGPAACRPETLEHPCPGASVDLRAFAGPGATACSPKAFGPRVLLPTPRAAARARLRVRRQRRVCSDPDPQPAARKPVDENPPARRPNDDWDAMVD